jgi:NADPH:quinone reductase-like Zn-dependent oxidoreductase
MTSTMRALVLERHNSPFTLTDIALPVSARGQVLVRYLACSLEQHISFWENLA